MKKTKLNDVFLSYHLPMESAMKVSDGNNYKLQHIRKEKFRREGRLPIAIKCSDKALEIGNAHLNGDTERAIRNVPDVLDT